MLYPLKFKPLYKDYIWGGRNLEKLGKTLPEGIVAESWEVSCHHNGVSIISNGEYEGMPLTEIVEKIGREFVGKSLSGKDAEKFPLLVKFIDANDRLSVQVHPEDSYAQVHENGEYGKNEMWYIMSAKPGARLIYDVRPGTTRESFAEAVKENRIEDCLKSIDVSAGDVINIPAGLIHAIGKGIVLAEIQQNSDTTYRVFDYNRVDAKGNQRPLHIEKALEVIDFDAGSRKEKWSGLSVTLAPNCTKHIIVANKYFSVELYDINGSTQENADGSRFYIYVMLEGSGEITYKNGSIPVKAGESILVPASMGKYSLKGSLKALKAYVPNLEQNVIAPLKQAGYSMEEILENVAGLK